MDELLALNECSEETQISDEDEAHQRRARLDLATVASLYRPALP